MNKEDLIKILTDREKNANVFQGRFTKICDDNWTYVRPAVDCMEPTIDLSNDGKVIYTNFCGFNDCKTTELTYYEFLNLYKR